MEELLPPEIFAEKIRGLLAKTALEKNASEQNYYKYQDNPVGFGEDILGDTYTDDVKVLMCSVRDNPITIAISSNATGKSLPYNTPVLTMAGFIPIGSLTPGDKVVGKDGTETEVLGVFPQGYQATSRITFNDETSVLCSDDHLWSAISSTNKYLKQNYKTHTTRELSLMLHRYMHIPMCDPISFQTKKLKVDPYVMGVLIGDGTLGQVARFDTEDDWILTQLKDRIKDAHVSFYRKTHYGIVAEPGKRNPFLATMRDYGMIGLGAAGKHIPEDYLWGDVEQRKLLLKGLMDTDGYIDARHSMSFCTISKQLSKQMQQLIWSLGGTAKIKSKYPTYTHNGEKKTGHKAYTIYIKLPFCPFSLPRKTERYIPETKLQKQAQRVIKKIESVGDYNSVCIKVDAQDGLFIINNFTVTHNTHSAGRIGCWWFLAFPNSQVYTAAAPPESNLKKLLWGEIGSITEKHRNLFDSFTLTNLHIQRSAQSFLTGVTIPSSGTEMQREAKFSGKHSPHILFILDEGDAIPDEVYRGIESCMTGGHARLLVMFNPRAEIGEAYRMQRDGRANTVRLSAFNHPNVITGEDVIPGAVTRETTVRRINEWCRPIVVGQESIDGAFVLPEFLEGIAAKSHSGNIYPPLLPGYYKVMEAAFSYMVLGQYPSQSIRQLISKDWIAKARSRWDVYVAEHGETPPAYTFGVMGQDVAEYGSDSNSACKRYGGYVARITTWDGMDIISSSERGAVEAQGMLINVDATGVGSGVGPNIRKLGGKAVDVKVASKPTERTELGEFYILRDQLWWACREWLRTGDAMLPPDETLIEELSIPTYEVQNGKIRVMKKDTMRELLKRSPDKADSLVLTFYEGGFFNECDLS